jgi:uncharacterized surface protein with fasciclin (FAS1) repeats
MKRESYQKWLFFIGVLCFTSSIISQNEKPFQTDVSPKSEVEVNQSLTISKYLQLTEDYSTFVRVLKEADLFTHLLIGKEFTVFAPGNSAFSQMPTTVLDQIFRSENNLKLKSIAGYHIVNSSLNLEEGLFKFNGTTNIVAMNNEIIEVNIGAEDALVLHDANGYPIDVMEKIVLSDGVVYRIDAVLLPQVDVKIVSN